MGLITMLASLPAFSLNVIEAADCWLRSLPVTTSGLRHGNVEVCGSDSIIPSATSLDSILPSVSFRQLPPTKSTILFGSVSNPPMVSEKKIVSTTTTSCLPIVLFSRSVEIHLVSRANIIGSRAVLIRLKSLFLMRLFMALNLEFSSLRFLSNNSTLVRAISGNFQSKEIIGIVSNIRSISSGFASVSFSHFSRSENSKARGLANVALQVHLSV
ncbi:hypothetical protein Bca52824_081585 [Brassica carinata]|uniref:RNase H type-1 domain-containing protein n=1 Tax=Brassica carinata TaxID=52824 RepID=A0A8X7PFG6_BRACI|nr:hypothetical protein Bca52824_081585 [Brassica carinata]